MTTISVLDGEAARAAGGATEVLALVVAWCAEEPERVGEVALFPPGDAQVFGRHDGEPKVVFYRQRPGELAPAAPLASRALSRKQLLVKPEEDGLAIERVGRCVMAVNGRALEKALVRPGDTVHLRGQMLLYCARRPAAIAPARYFPREKWGAFGEADEVGLLGEAPLAWKLRDRIAFAAKADTHVLVLGPSGTGKELAARAIHALSPRAAGPFVARNAATFPPGLIDAELFGNVKNYPNPGTPERQGLIGHAAGGTLFLDELGELPAEMQAHLLRVLDRGGEYQRLGEASARRADIRLVGATNRDPSALKHDLLARFTIHVEAPPLAERMCDAPLLARHLLRAARAKSPDVAARFFSNGQPRVDPELVEQLLHRAYDANVRELEALLWRAMAESESDTIGPLHGQAEPEAPAPGADDIRACLRREGGNVSRAARALGLSRYALYRLMRKHGIDEAH